MSIFDIFDKLAQERAQKEQDTGPIEWLVVGLGNPGSQYENTNEVQGTCRRRYTGRQARIVHETPDLYESVRRSGARCCSIL